MKTDVTSKLMLVDITCTGWSESCARAYIMCSCIHHVCVHTSCVRAYIMCSCIHHVFVHTSCRVLWHNRLGNIIKWTVKYAEGQMQFKPTFLYIETVFA